jgi:hypothetical protein
VQGLQELKEEVFIVHRYSAVNRVTETITEALITEYRAKDIRYSLVINTENLY